MPIALLLDFARAESRRSYRPPRIVIFDTACTRPGSPSRLLPKLETQITLVLDNFRAFGPRPSAILFQARSYAETAMLLRTERYIIDFVPHKKIYKGFIWWTAFGLLFGGLRYGANPSQ